MSNSFNKSLRIIVCLIAILLIMNISRQTVNAQPGRGIDLATAGLKGRVQVITSGLLKTGKKEDITLKRTFDREGNLVEEIMYAQSPFSKVTTPFMKSSFSIKDSILNERSYDIASRENSFPVVATINGKTPEFPPPPTVESDGAIMHQARVKRDKESNKVEVTWYKRLVKDSRILYLKTFVFSKEGLVEEMDFYSSEGSVPERHVFKYNSDGIETENRIISSDGSIHSKLIFSEIKRDAKGNWIQRNVDRNGYKTVEFRKITYFPSSK